MSVDSMSSLNELLSFYEMKNVVDLINLYSEINLKVIEDGKNTCPMFFKFTQNLVSIIDVLKKLNIVLNLNEQSFLQNYGDEEDKNEKINLWNYFDIFHKVNEKSLKANKGSKIRSTDATITNIPTIEMDEESEK